MCERVRILRVFERNTCDVRIIFFTTNQFLQILLCQIKTTHHSIPEGELTFQMQAMTQMMERVNFVMGNVCDKLDRVEKRGNEVGTSTQNVKKLGAEPKANNGSRAERPRWADYKDFEEAVDDIGDGSFEDEAIGHREGFQQPGNRRDYGNRTRGQFGQRENSSSSGHNY